MIILRDDEAGEFAFGSSAGAAEGVMCMADSAD
jgi:hypothetical protein